MDNQKDKKDIMSGHSSDLYDSSALILKAHSDIAAQRQAVLKRTEKIVAAIYLVSSLLPEADPLRLSLRNQALDFLSFITDAVDFFQSVPQQHVVDGVVVKTQAIISLLGIAHVSGYVSEMNKAIISNELMWFADEVTKKGHVLLSGIVLEDDFFGSTHTQSAEHQITHTAQKTGLISKGQKTTKVSSQQKKSAGSQDKASSKRVRAERIMEVVKKQGPITIKDIAAQVKECGEKTIQRELMSLIKDKLIRRQGERRWSVYSAV